MKKRKQPPATTKAPFRRVRCLVLWVCVLSACSLPSSGGRPLEIVVKGDSFTLAWDPPSDGLFGVPTAYRVYYRRMGTRDWVFLAEAPSSPEPVLRIGTEDLSFGRYEFAVASVGPDDGPSALHSSGDRNAAPITGWFLNWIGSR